MHFLLQLFGGSPLLYAGAIVALIAGIFVLAKVVELLGRLTLRRPATAAPRLALVETARVDRHRSVVLIRRDDVEYAVLTGGPEDLILEAAIPAPQVTARQAAPAAQAASGSMHVSRPVVAVPVHQSESSDLSRALTALERDTHRTPSRGPAWARSRSQA